MKKSLKKNLAILLTLLITVSLVPFSASAYYVGQTVGYAGPTDIVATINGYQIESYNVDGYTYICVEDLKYYGFDVTFDYNSKTLGFTRNWTVSSIAPHYSNPNFWSIGSSNTRRPILYTDIATYANGTWVGSSNINGQTIINFNDLAQFGQVNYDNDRREISLTMPGVDVNPFVMVALDFEDVETEWRWDVLVRAKGNMLVAKYVSTQFNSLSEIGNLNEFANNVRSGEIYSYYQDCIDEYRSFGYDLSSIYVEYYTKNGESIVTTQIYR